MSKRRQSPDSLLRREILAFVKDDVVQRYDYANLEAKYPNLMDTAAVQLERDRLASHLDATHEELCEQSVRRVVENVVARANNEILERLGGWHHDTKGLPPRERIGATAESSSKNAATVRSDWMALQVDDFLATLNSLNFDARLEFANRTSRRITGENIASIEGLLQSQAETSLESARSRIDARPSDLPFVQMSAYEFRHQSDERELSEVFDEWLASDSSVLVLNGPSGSGKRSGLVHSLPDAATRHHRFVLYSTYPKFVVRRHNADVSTANPGLAAFCDLVLPPVSEPHDHLAQEILSKVVFVLDDFDSFTARSGDQFPEPDLGDIADLATEGAKLVLITQRTLHDHDHLCNQVERNTTEVQDARLWTIAPLATERLRAAVDSMPAVSKIPVNQRQLLDRVIDHPVGALRRPLFVQLLFRSITLGKERTDHGPFTLASLLHQYIEAVLDSQMSQKNSHLQIPGKRVILRSIAWQMFLQTRTVFQSDAPSLSADQVQLLILEGVTQNPMYVRVPKGRLSDYLWVRDFFSSVPLIQPKAEDGEPNWVPPYEFAFPALYDYFLAETILLKFRAREPLGLADDADFEENQISSLVLYFLKQGLTTDIESGLCALAKRPTLSNIDRLIMIYLLEDNPQMAEVLQAAPNDYRSFLYGIVSRLTSVLARVVRYQIVILEGSEQRAHDFIDWLEYEQGEHREPEGQLPAFIEPYEGFLLTRLDNDVLRPARPITVFRLGQLGGAAALVRLRLLLQESGVSEELRTRTDTAIRQIQKRIGGDT